MAFSGRVVVLTGAGISAESGIRTFRATDGLWEEHRIEDVASPDGFRRDPALVHRFYSERRAALADVEPNEAHLAIARFEREFSDDLVLVTQNVDDLHERSGSSNVVHMHGELRKVRCTRTNEVFSWDQPTTQTTPCPCCRTPGALRPHIVWFGEIPLFMEQIQRALVNATHFVSIGTSGHVYPAAGFCEIARRFGAKTIELNLEPSKNGNLFDERRYGRATEIVPAFFDELSEAGK